jgi:hypothetical protein
MVDHTRDIPPHQHGGTDAPECTTCTERKYDPELIAWIKRELFEALYVEFAGGVSPTTHPRSEQGEIVQTLKFVRKPFYVDAVRVTSANMSEVAQWCGGTVRQAKPDGDVQQGRIPQKYVEVPVYLPMNDRQKMAFVGDWVLFAGKGYKVYTNPAFNKTFQAVSVEVPQQVIDRVSGRDSVTGQFVSEEYVEANPETTTTEIIQQEIDPIVVHEDDIEEEHTVVKTPPNHGTTHERATPKLVVKEEPAPGTGTTRRVIEPGE